MVVVNRRASFWILLIVASVFACALSLRHFSRVFPIIDLDLRMNRQEALEQSRALAVRYGLGPLNPRYAATFAEDGQTQVYVELEGGGAKALDAMVTGKLYAPYTWKVRHFKEYEKRELTVTFKPDGTPYEFVDSCAEDFPGPALSPEEAERIARSQAHDHWGILFDEYTRIEMAHETCPNGRVDHTFVYERPTPTINNARYRLRLSVCGDRFTGLTHFVHIPQEFINRYKNIRSSNKTLAHAASVIIVILYVMLIGGIGFFMLSKRSMLSWKEPIFVGVVAALLAFLAAINNLALSWGTSYITTMSPAVFLSMDILGALVQAFAVFGCAAVIAAIAEGLTRAAFPRMPQLWTLGRLEVASSRQVAACIVLAYLAVPFFFVYLVLFYAGTTHYLGWWTPSWLLVDPNILATYAPWLGAVYQSLSAGFLEECLFRAFPLAAAALMGTIVGKRNWWITATFIIQVLVFGAAHANYPGLPSYSRLVELVLPSCFFGLMYLRGGLLPGIISHFIYDLLFFSMPLFASSAPYAWVNKLLVIVIGTIPLLVILVRRLQRGSFGDVPARFYNDAWLAPMTKSRAPVEPVVELPEDVQAPVLSWRQLYAILAVGVAALFVWLACTHFASDAPALTITRSQAGEYARKVLEEKGHRLDSSWLECATITYYGGPIDHSSGGDQRRFIWTKAGREVYKKLLENYLDPALWRVSFIRTSGSPQERAEKYVVGIANRGEVRYYAHKIPEDRPGMSLTQDEAKQKACTALQAVYGRSCLSLENIAATSLKKPNRLDWSFTFADHEAYKLPEGQARVDVMMSGDECTSYERYIHVPEGWVRDEATKNAWIGLTGFICMSILGLLWLAAAILVLARPTSSIKLRAVLSMWAILCVAFLIEKINSIPSLMTLWINAHDPYAQQLFRMITGTALGIISTTAVVTLFIIVGWYAVRTRKAFSRSSSALVGGVLGICFCALESLVILVWHPNEPLWASYGGFDATIPALNVVIDVLVRYALSTSLCLLVLALLEHCCAATIVGWLGRMLLIVIIAFAVTGASFFTSLSYIVVYALVLGSFGLLVYSLCRRELPTTVPWLVATVFILKSVQQGCMGAYPGVMLAHVVTAVAVALAAWCWNTWQVVASRPVKLRDGDAEARAEDS